MILSLLLSLGIIGSAHAEALSCGAPASPATTAKPASVSTAAPAALKAVYESSSITSGSASPSELLEKASANFKARYPKTRVNSFRLTPMPGLYEASVGKEVAYFDESARYVLSGRLLDMERGEDLTQIRLQEIRRIDFDKLPLDKAVVTVKGSGARKVAVFTDVDCPFSRKLSETLAKLEDVTIYTFLFPLTSIHPQAHAKSEIIWCAKDSEKHLNEVLSGKPLSIAKKAPLCDAPIDEIIQLASSHGIGGTPTIINEAGDRTAGALPLDKLEAFVKEGSIKSAAAKSQGGVL